MRFFSVFLLLTLCSTVGAEDSKASNTLPQKLQRITPYGKHYCIDAYEVTPRSVEEVVSVISIAQNTGRKLSVLGAGMSQGRQAISSVSGNIIINTRLLREIRIDPETQIATVGAGATWGDLQNKANELGLAVQVMQASNIFSIGGSLSANCHGWAHKIGSLRNTVISLTIVNSRGELQRLTPSDELFNYVIGGYGWFGVIVESEILLTRNVELEERGIEIEPAKYYSYFSDIIKDNDSIDMHIYRLSLEPKKLFKTGVVVNWVRLGNDGKIASLVNEDPQGSSSDRFIIGAVRHSKLARKIAWNVEKAKALIPKRGTRNELMRPPINFVFSRSEKECEWLQEYFVKEKDLFSFLKFLAEVLNANDVPVLNASVRFVKKDDKSVLSYAPDEDRFAVVLFFNQSLLPSAIQKTSSWVRQVVDYLVSHGGSYYLPYQHFTTFEQFRACYPGWEKVLQKKWVEDPQTVFENGLFSEYIQNSSEITYPSYFRKVFCKTFGQRDRVDAFLDNIFMQIDSKKFFSLVDSIVADRTIDEQQVYKELLNKISDTKKDALLPFSSLRALRALKKDLSRGVSQLLVDKQELKGYVEIGYNGRLVRALKKYHSISAPIYVVNEKESYKDFFEIGLRPYNTFVPLHDYEPIQIPAESVEIVACYIGLHHIPPYKLGPFLDSIKRILKPGGSFILMEHDASSPELQELVHVVHSVFNAATGVSVEENQNEVRNFRSLKYWIDQVEEHGLKLNNTNGAYIRAGDSTLNTLVRFDKPLQEPAAVEDSVANFPGYIRPQIQTYLTAPEWQNVRSAQEYARFVETRPAYAYPFFKDVGGFWKVFWLSCKAANQEHSFTQLVASDYTLMNLFIGTTMIVEYSLKGLLSAPFAYLLPSRYESDPRAESEKERLRSLKAYSEFINHTPFYEYPYFQDIQKYWSSYRKDLSSDSGRKIKNFFAGSALTLEYAIKGVVASPIRFIFASPQVKEDETIHLLIEDKANCIHQVDSRIKVLQFFPDSVKHIEIPRYLVFTEIVKKMASFERIKIINIAGQKKIQLDIKRPRSAHLIRQDLSGCRMLYIFPVPTDMHNEYLAYEVEVGCLNKAINHLESTGAEIIYLHDF